MIRVATHFAPTFTLRPFITLKAWMELSRQRKALAALDEAGLKDIGVSKTIAEQEATRVFWDAPDHWSK